MKEIVITGGHLTPALSLIENLKEKKEIRLYFLGRKYSTEGSKNLSAEYQIISKLNIHFHSITAGRIQRKFTEFTIPALLKIPVGFIQSFIYLLKKRPNLIVAFGGYLSFPVVFTGWILGIKSVTHEQSTKPGIANKLNSLFVEKIYLSWPGTQKYFAKDKSQVIGNLTRQAIFKKNASDVRIQKFLKTNRKLIFVTGGNQGSHFINKLIFKLLPQLSDYQIIHQVGTANYHGDLDIANKIKYQNYHAIDYIKEDDIGAAYSRSDLVISRSGANTVWDLATLAKVAILVPLPISASGEQKANAQILEEAGSAIVANQENLNTSNLREKIDYIMGNYPKFQKNAQIFQKTLPQNANQTLASEIKKLIGTKTQDG
ncbi:hypothetical protein A3A49_02305 [Candidatus Curtissbacteria bacterium RIFCSPLOWO2_01_FULL_38_11b]|uniref:UDP-N-acetylglucosamine--N-acetylmuramyl-(pentapeptide) pyrophosphoryl-undecaprenol N-acetylglucosamine transferase n=1 Tax=Candidatus Curtissbacteria bacterium RIFCSPLOWO2_01_FULL_38_11b TaxID=1797725 RepID=A0A1F5GZ43_9BACT|nr:MAG: hypothetical protein A3A49_02305 [Candidatus Curtissbacteria bacterium RIFCSPLOWO2_01_FULL_38_11b]